MFELLDDLDKDLREFRLVPSALTLIGSPLTSVSKKQLCDISEKFVAKHGNLKRFSFPCTTRLGTRLNGKEFLYRPEAKSILSKQSGGTGLRDY